MGKEITILCYIVIRDEPKGAFTPEAVDCSLVDKFPQLCPHHLVNIRNCDLLCSNYAAEKEQCWVEPHYCKSVITVL